MDASLIITGAMTLLKPLLEKVGEKAAETIGEKLAEKTVEKSFWKKVKGLFIIEGEEKTVEDIENKSVANSQDIAIIESKITKEVETNPQFAAELWSTLNISKTNELYAEQLLISLQKDKEKLAELVQDRRDAVVGLQEQYELEIRRLLRRMEKDEQQFLNLLNTNK